MGYSRPVKTTEKGADQMLGLLGIEDGYVLAAYLLCIGSTALCVIYGLVSWNRGEEEVVGEDVQWAAEEDKVEENI